MGSVSIALLSFGADRRRCCAQSWLVSLLKTIKPISALSIACSISSLSTHWLLKKEAHELGRILISTDWVTMHLTAYLHGVWASRSPVTTLVVAHTPIVGKVLDIPSPLSASRIWVRVRVSVRRCYRFSGLYAFHLSGDVAVGTRRPRIAVLMA